MSGSVSVEENPAQNQSPELRALISSTWHDTTVSLFVLNLPFFIVKEKLKMHHVVWIVVCKINQVYGYFTQTLVLLYFLVLCFSLVCDSVLIELILFVSCLSFSCSSITLQLQNGKSNYEVYYLALTRQNKEFEFKVAIWAAPWPQGFLWLNWFDFSFKCFCLLSMVHKDWTDGPRLDFATILNIKVNALLWRVSLWEMPHHKEQWSSVIY